MDEITAIRRLFGKGKGRSVTMLTGKVTGTSSDGEALVDLGGDTITEDGDQSIPIPTSPHVDEGDYVLVMAGGRDPVAPVVIGAVGSGDKVAAEVAHAREAASEAGETAQAASAAAGEAVASAEDAQAAAGEAEAHAQAALASASSAIAAASAVGEQVAVQQGQIEDAMDLADATAQAVTGMQQTLTSHSQSITDLTSVTAEHTASIQTTANGLSSVVNRVTATEGTVGTLRTDVEAAQTAADAAQGSADAAASAASTAQAAASGAASAATAAQAVASSKNRIFRQPSQPTAAGTGDVWVDSDNGNRLHVWDGSAWVESKDGAITTAQASANAAQAAADAAIVSTVTEYAVNFDPDEPPEGGWRSGAQPRVDGGVVWMRNTVTYGSGEVEVLPAVCVTGNDGAAGEDACTLHVHSSNGTAFKNSDIGTTLTVRVFRGAQVIEDRAALVAAFGAGARLQWSVRPHGAAGFSVIPSSDPRLSGGGFALDISAADVDSQAVFDCQLVV